MCVRSWFIILADAQSDRSNTFPRVRLQLRPALEPAPLFCDLFDKTSNTLYEAKGTVARHAIRMAIGQLADYSRLIKPTPRKALLLPQEPRPDLLDLLAQEGIAVVWRSEERFESSQEPILD